MSAVEFERYALGIRFRVYVQPRASRARLIGPHQGALKVSVMAAPVDGAANQALIRLLAKEWSLPRRAFVIIQGLQSRHKVIQIEGLEKLPIED